MTDPVETLNQMFRWARDDAHTERRWTDETIEKTSRALLAQIAPALVADAVAKEREECAKVVENEPDDWIYDGEAEYGVPPDQKWVAAAIRARGDKP